MYSWQNRLALVSLLVASAGCAAQSNPVVDAAAEAAAIEAVDQQLLAAARSHDAAAFAAVFAPDGLLLFPNRPIVRGQEAIQQAIAPDFAMPGFSVTWEQSDLMLAASGDLAVSNGTYHLTFSLPDGPVEDHGKYMTVWRKVDGEWRVAADMTNTDVPMPDM